MGTSNIIRKSAVSAIVFAAGIVLACVCALGLGAQDAHAAPKSRVMSMGSPSTFTVDGNTYKVTERYKNAKDPGEVVLTKYGSNNTKPTINMVTYKGKKYEVEAIGRDAFNNAKGKRVTSVTLGRNVESIQYRAFYGCSNLSVLDIAKSDVIEVDYSRKGNRYYLDDVEIASQAFKGAGVKSIKVKCGNGNAGYQKVVKNALVSKGMRTSVTVIR